MMYHLFAKILPFLVLLVCVSSYYIPSSHQSATRIMQKRVYQINTFSRFPIQNKVSNRRIRPDLLHYQSLVEFQDVGVALGTSVLAYIWLQIWVQLTSANLVASTLSRKIIHCTSAPLFLCTWPWYTNAEGIPRVVASIVPAIQVIRLIYTGLKESNSNLSSSIKGIDNNNNANNSSSLKSDGLAMAISRSGNRKEALQGPLIYALVLFLATIFCFRETSVGVIAISQMAAGDGLADIVGRKWGKVKWPFSMTKSMIGSLAFVMGGFLASIAIVTWLGYTGCLHYSNAIVPELVIRIGLISIACAAVELIPIGDDNISVPLAAALLATLFIQPLLD